MWDLILLVPDHCLSFYFAVHSMVRQGPKAFSCGQRRLISQGGCPGLSESSLSVPVILFVLPCIGSNNTIPITPV